ncbi:CRISPR-associated endonuclease Cas2 [Candidatus Saccharibacteria bacterium]|nr:CRISPR-associated endonuclease Cas2 [Candidatus Saccharibacteria bacterium]
MMAEQIHAKTHRHNRIQIRRQLGFMLSKGLVEKRGSYRAAEYQISSRGTARLEELTLSQLQATSSVWDGKWRLVFFDIPEVSRSARDQIRRLLKELGFKQLQLSVWVHPLPCLDYFQKIQEAYGIKNHLFLAQTSEINIPDSVLAHFRRNYPKQKIK